MWARLCVSMRVPLAATIPDALICRFDTARTVVRMPYNKAVFTTPQKSPPLTHASWFRKDRHHGVRWLRQHSRLRARGRALQELLDEKDDDSDSVTTETVSSLEWQSPLKVLLYPDPKLRASNATISCFDESLCLLAEEMFEVMYQDDGVGLAAPQVGVNVRLMVFNESGDRNKKELEVVLVNPRIISTSNDAKVFEEGCLSFPEIYGDVVRPSKVRVKAQDLTGKSFMVNVTGFPARIFQHEYDHLQGKLFCDRMEPKALEDARPKLVAMEEVYLKNNPDAIIKRVT